MHSSILRRILLNFMALCLVFMRPVFQFSHLWVRISSSFDLSITEVNYVVEMRIWWVRISNMLVLHFKPWIEDSVGGLLVPKGLYNPVAKYIGICLEYEYELNCQDKSKFCKFISNRSIFFLRHRSILRRISLNFMVLYLVFFWSDWWFFQFSHFLVTISNFFDLSITEES
jgi:hypothetical protein